MQQRLGSLQPLSVQIGDDSALHAGHAGARSGGGHYNLHIVSAAFAGKNTVARHRMIYAALDDMMKGEIHALAIRAQTAEEAGLST
ncbi:BolA/IbaG family iron-sulfur metabolism protein [Azoarcus communis]|uniref:BolA family transcriptional regulator n=1 Tax=Parazoarcus communis SWub3 = DSM 12120 TaxID=1121029 RepID=A0A323UR55_9RHOO|nr:BolA family protein [Parazoarcus communis]NMG46928.1 BolA/IbaG family iron-sulfur metabolism protein [Parazoarcus communis]NMG72521.1 BolA/IbaG family iron-sulfur metabolism protein [Parazoarcus communis SWub3 = DSM 12120]PZA14994.1 BolA family transcriptional regulator [Azoarcus communis] [Parazoarcus communis SWub3 = DSM 12120]